MYKKIKILVITSLFVSSLAFFSCSNKNETEKNGKIIAQTQKAKLYLNDIDIPQEQDSSEYLKKYAKDWLTTQLLFEESEKYLNEKEKQKLQKLINDYKKFLYITNYKQYYTDKNLDTIISKSDLFNYYRQNKANYILKENIVKATYIKVPRKAPKVWQVRKWVKSNKAGDVELLNAYCVQYADKLDDFDGEWIAFNKVLSIFPKQVSNQEYTLKHKDFLETRDTSFYYYLDIDSFKLVNDTAPMSYIEPQLSDKILAKRKKELLLQLKNNIFDDAINNHQATINKEFE